MADSEPRDESLAPPPISQTLAGSLILDVTSENEDDMSEIPNDELEIPEIRQPTLRHSTHSPTPKNRADTIAWASIVRRAPSASWVCDCDCQTDIKSQSGLLVACNRQLDCRGAMWYHPECVFLTNALNWKDEKKGLARKIRNLCWTCTTCIVHCLTVPKGKNSICSVPVGELRAEDPEPEGRSTSEVYKAKARV
ncbi:hypothetical protein HDU86_001531 [Geranomyces michiganensis]|nr:hypothetical protein HDU86_001531 [Geranomyces michiganensis]